ncbi:hypothetical protein AB1K91_05235 [Terribacillus sp. 179-K 1B1 HS]|uniref:hypothetical protein n=1 Tax=Terribacillus sp. 179-K 1B1 HS TaxID=3142388 RepID=UPI0039A2B4AF
MRVSKHDIHEAIDDYRWMMNVLIERRKESLNGSQGLVAKWGIEATLPKPQGDPSDPIYQEMLRIERFDKNNKKLQDKVRMIQKHSKAVKGMKDQLVLDGVLNGLTLREIASQLNMSLTAVKRRKDIIVNEIYMSVQVEQMVQMEQNA